MLSLERKVPAMQKVAQKVVALNPHKTAAFHVWKRMEKRYAVQTEYTPQPAARKLLRQAERLVQSRRRLLRRLEMQAQAWRQVLNQYDKLLQRRAQFEALPRAEQEARMKYGRQTRREMTLWEETAWMRGEWAFGYYEVFAHRAACASAALENAQRLRDKLENDIYSRRFAR